MSEQQKHHSHRESFEIAGAKTFLEAHMHDQAATVSLAICPLEGTAFAFRTLLETMVIIASQVEAHGGIVGHIKAFAREGDRFSHASVTAAGFEPTCEGEADASFGEGADVQFVAIALFVNKEELASICKGGSERIGYAQ